MDELYGRSRYYATMVIYMYVRMYVHLKLNLPYNTGCTLYTYSTWHIVHCIYIT
jgi:hypothetical protein